MSIFNEANEMASELVYGTDYDGNPTGRPKPDRLVLVNGDSTAVVTAKEEIAREWDAVASAIEQLLNDGYWLVCDVNVSWNGPYDSDCDREPDGNYLPCRKPVAVTVGGRHLYQEHALATGKVKLVVDEPVKNNVNVEEL